jgi:hypothetical protein
LTAGFGIAENSARNMVVDMGSDCMVVSGRGEFKKMGDPDHLNPGDYEAWSFAVGCDASHGDSGSAMVDRNTGRVLGIIWTGKIPKSEKAQSSAYIRGLVGSNSPEVWQELTYAVPAAKMGEVLRDKISHHEISREAEPTIRAILGL